MAGQNGVVLHTGTYSQLRMDWSSTPNVANNQSSFTATIYVQVTTSGWNIGPWTDYNGSYFGTSSGHTFNGSIPNVSGRYNMKTFNTTVNHASDGKGSINIVWKWGVNSSWGGVVNPSGSRTLTLDTIARATQPSVSPSTQNIGSNVTISTPRASGSFTHKLTYDFGSKKNITIASNVATSYNWALSKDLAFDMANTTSSITIYCETFNGSTSIGKKSTVLTVKIPENDEFYPAIVKVLLTEQSTGLPETKDSFLQGKSKIKVDVTGSGSYGSSIKGYEIKINGATYTVNGAVTDFIVNPGAQKAVIKVTDSRNRSKTQEVTFDVIPYEDPKITSLSATRCNSDGSPNDEGDHASVVFSTVFSNVQLTATSHKIKYRSDTSSGTWQEVAVSGQGSQTNKVVIISNVNIDNSYDVVLEAKDYFTTTSRSVELATGYTLVDFRGGGRGIAFGEVAEEEGMSVNLDANFKKKLVVNGVDLSEILKIGSGIFLIKRDVLFEGNKWGENGKELTFDLTLPSGTKLSDYDELIVEIKDQALVYKGYYVVHVVDSTDWTPLSFVRKYGIFFDKSSQQIRYKNTETETNYQPQVRKIIGVKYR